VRTSFRPLRAAHPEAAGRYSDLRIGSKYVFRARCPEKITGLSNPDLFDHLAHSGRRLLTLPFAPALADYDIIFMPYSPASWFAADD